MKLTTKKLISIINEEIQSESKAQQLNDILHDMEQYFHDSDVDPYTIGRVRGWLKKLRNLV